MALYLDLDGVFADFRQNLFNHGLPLHRQAYHAKPKIEWTEDDHKRSLKVEECMRIPGFWEELPLCQDAYTLWDYSQQYNPTLLTALPGLQEWDERVRWEKQNWIDKYFGFKTPVIYCLRSEKVNYVKDGLKDILLDDTVRNVQEWTEAGGLGILHTDVENSIKKLNYIYKECLV